MNQFAIVYMVNPKLNINKFFKDQFWNFFWKKHFIQVPYLVWNVFNKENTCFIVIVIFDENRTTNPVKLFRVLICIIYYFKDNYVWIEYLGCKSKNSSVICFDKICMDIIHNELIGIVIPELIMNLISFHLFLKDTNSTVVLSCCTWLAE